MFIGATRQQILDRILAEWHSAYTHKRPCLVVLVGEPGFGKTKIVHELYSKVMAAQDEPSYWPAYIVDEDLDLIEQLGRQRKAVRPVGFTPPPGAEPGILWLGADIKGSAGLSVDQTIDDLIGQITLHLAGALQRHNRNRQVVSLARRMVSLFGLIPEAFAVGADTVELINEIRRAFETDAAGRRISYNAGFEERLAALYRTVRALWGKDGRGGPPIIIVIEDLHAAQEPTVALIEQLLSAEKLPVLIVATSQAQALASAKVPRELVYGDLPGKTVIEVDPLPSDDIEELVAAYLPRTPEHIRAALAQRATGNPYQIQLFLISQSHRIRNGRLDIALEDIADLPLDLDGILTRLWKDLDSRERMLLGAFALAGSQAPVSVDAAILDELRTLRLTATTTSGWVRADQLSRVFLELARWHIASTLSPLSRQERRSVITRGVNAIETMLIGTVQSDRSMVPLLRTSLAEIIEPAIANGVAFDRPAVAAELRAWSSELRYSGQVQQSLRIAELGLEVLGDIEALAEYGAIDIALELLRLRSITTSTLRGQGDPDGILAAERYQYWADRFAMTHPEHVVRAWTRLSRACRTPRRDEDLLRRSRDALSFARSALDQGTWPDRRLERDVRAAAYPFLSREGHRRDAALEAQRVLELTIELFGSSHPLALSGLTDVAFYTRRFDKRRGAELYRDVLEARVRLWGDASHVGTTGAAANLSVALADLGEPEAAREAIALADHAYGVRLRAWGESRVGTFVALGIKANARIEYAFHLEPQEAEELLVDGLEMALASRDGLLRLRSQTQAWRQREYIAVAQCALGDRNGLADLATLTAEREAGHAEPWTRGDLRLLAMKRARALRGFGLVEEADSVSRSYRLHQAEADVLQ